MIDFQEKILNFTMKVIDFITGTKNPVEVTPTSNTLAGISRTGLDKPGGGNVNVIEYPVEFSASSQQIAGLFPFCVGTATPMVGTPLGRNQLNGQVVTGDPINYYLSGLISAPAGITFGLNGRGKSSLIIRQCLGIADSGVNIIIPGDVKPDFTGMIEELEGQVIRIGPKLDAVNPLDAGPIWDKLEDLRAYDAEYGTDKADEVLAEIYSRRVAALESLFRLSGEKKAQAVAGDSSLLSIAVREASEAAMQENPPRQPVIADVKEAVLKGSPAMRASQMTETDEEYFQVARPLILALNIFDAQGPFGDTFSRQTTKSIQLGNHLSFDISAVRNMGSKNMLAAVQLACWAYSQALVYAAHRLAEIGLMPQDNYFMVLDEAWMFLSIDQQMVHYLNEYSRLNRTIGAGQQLVFHTPKDLQLENPKLQGIAEGLLERSPFKIYGALAANDMELLDKVAPLTVKEKKRLISWTPDGGVDETTGKVLPPVGRGKFMMKALAGTGIPFEVHLTEIEKQIHDTNAAWAQAMEVSQGAGRV